MQVSEQRSSAARANGALSRGPKSPEGKTRSSQNAIKHGLLSSIVVLHNESQEAFDRAVQSYCDRFQPADEVERDMVEELVAASWRARRALAIETQMMDAGMDSLLNVPSELDRLTGAFSELAATPKLRTVHRYQVHLHGMKSRLLRDFITLRKNVPPAALPPDPEPEPLPAARTQAPISQIAQTNPKLLCPQQHHPTSGLCRRLP
jgi:hypothetical protein